MSTTITFDQMERDADRTLAVVLWAKYFKNMALAAAGMALLHQVTKTLVTRLSHGDKLATLSDEQAVELAKKLTGIHAQLDFLLHRTMFAEWRRKWFFSASMNGLEESNDDLADIAEDLILSGNSEFRSMLVECVRALPSHSAELVGRM